MNFARNFNSNDESYEARDEITYGADENNFRIAHMVLKRLIVTAYCMVLLVQMSITE